MKWTQVACAAVCLLLLCGSSVWADVVVTMKDGGEIEARRAWLDGKTVYVRVNDDVLLDFPAAEVDLGKTKLSSLKEGWDTTVLLNRLIEESGLFSQLDNFVDIAIGGMGENSNDSTEVMARVFRQSYEPATARKAMRGHFASKMDERMVLDVLAWYHGPLGRKVAALESNPVQDFRQKMEEFLSSEATDETKARFRLFTDLDVEFGITDMMVRIEEKTMRALSDALPTELPNRSEARKKIEGEMRGLKGTVEKQRRINVAKQVFIFRNLTMQELNDYRDFLESASGKAYTRANCAATEKVLDGFLLKVKKNFRKELKSLMHG